MPRFRNLPDKHPNFIRGYGFEGGAGTTMFPGNAHEHARLRRGYKKTVRDYAGAFISMGGFGEVLPRYENQVALDPVRKDKWGIPVLRFNYQFGDNEKKMCQDMADDRAGDVRARGIRDRRRRSDVLTEGWSIHELGTARMGADPKTSVLNQFQQSHDVKNLFVVDGSSHVSASCQNPTWTIMALAWRSCDYLADRIQEGEPVRRRSRARRRRLIKLGAAATHRRLGRRVARRGGAGRFARPGPRRSSPAPSSRSSTS